jgi:hypothetical protein
MQIGIAELDKRVAAVTRDKSSALPADRYEISFGGRDGNAIVLVTLRARQQTQSLTVDRRTKQSPTSSSVG